MKGIKQTVTEKLSKRPGYLRWSAKRIADRFGCAEVTAKRIKRNLSEVKANYEVQFKS